ncbi:hypothetical protein ACLKA6_009410 [Drosophila palustris]
MGVQAWNNAAYDYLAGNSRLRAVLGQFVVSSMCWSTLCCHFKVNVEECSSDTRIKPDSTPDAAEAASGSRSIDNAAIRASYFEESSTKRV